MVDYMNAPLSDIKAAIIADGIIDADEASKIRARIMDDGKVDHEEAEFLFEVNDAVTGNDNSPAFEDLFVECITAYVLQDDLTPGVLDEDEWNWLKTKVEGDGQVDPLESRLLKNIAANANGTPDDFKAFIANI